MAPEHPFIALKNLLVDGAAATALAADRRHRIAVVLVLVSGLSMAGMMVMLKMGADSLSLWQLVVFKSALPALFLLPIFRVANIPLLPKGQYRLYALRVSLAGGAVICWIYSLAHLPLGVATAIGFSKGLFVLWLATVFLSERLTLVNIVTTLVGCLGVLFVIDVSSGGPLTAGLIGLLGAGFAGLLTIVIKRMTATEPTLRMMFYPQAAMAVFFLVPALLTWQPMDGWAIALACGTGLFGMITQWCFISAYRLTDVSSLAPLEYSRLVFAVLTGALVFAEIPSSQDVVGMVLIVGASYAAFRFRDPAPSGPAAKASS